MNYKVFVDKKQITTYPARVSKIPFNMVWSGYQRDMAQTEIAYFVSFDMEKAVEIEVVVEGAAIDNVRLRPVEFGIDYTVCENTIKIKLESPKLFTVEVNGTNEVLSVFANEKDTFVADENTIYFGPGEHDAGFILPKKGQTVYLAEGAVVYGGVFAYKEDDVTVCGRGILDSSKLYRGAELEEKQPEVYKLLKSYDFDEVDVGDYSSFVAYNCKNFKVDGIILKDAPFWSLIVRNNCEDVEINNVKIIGQWRYNSDGVDICASKNVVLKNSFIRSFDDSIVVRAVCLQNEKDGCENILVENNVVWCDWGKNLEIWNGKKNSVIKDVVFKDNYLIHSTDICISIDTWYGAENIVVENIKYQNIYIDTETDGLAPCIQQNKEHTYPYYNQTMGSRLRGVNIGASRLGGDIGNQGVDSSVDCSGFNMYYRNISFENVVCTSQRLLDAKVVSKGIRELKNITFENCVFKKIMYL